MSIINDALKKVQSSLSHGKKTEPADPASAQQANPYSDAMPQYSMPAAPESSDAPAPAASVSTPAAAAAKVTTAKAKESNMVYILGAICLLIALFAPIVDQQSVFNMIVNPKKSKSSSTTVSRSQKSSSASATVAQKAASIKEGLAKSLAGFNAPQTAPTVVRSPSGQKIALNGIMAQGSKNVALIDGYVYEAGETVQGIKIVAINANNIVIEENGEQRTLKVGQ